MSSAIELFSESFEDTTGWTHTAQVYDAATGAGRGAQEVGNIFVPKGWGFFFKHGPCAHDPQNVIGWSQPEACHIPATVDAVRVRTGLQGYKAFGFYRIVDCGLSKVITGLRPGLRIKVKAHVHAWSNNGTDRDNPRYSEGVGTAAFAQPAVTAGLSDAARNATFQVGIATGDLSAGPYVGKVTWGKAWHIYNRYAPIEVEAVAEGPTAIIYLRGFTRWPFKHNDLYFDDVTVTIEDPAPEPEPEPEPPAYDRPREQYERTAFWLSPELSPAECHAAFDLAAKTFSTVAHSADDAAGWGLAVRRVKAVWPDWIAAARIADMAAFWAEHYPGAQIEHILPNGKPATGSTPAPEPPPTPAGPTYRNGPNYIGLHVQDPVKDWTAYLRDAKPNLVKVFSVDQAVQARLANPEATVILRFHVDNDGEWLSKGPAAYLNLYEMTLESAARTYGADLALSSVNVVETLNELIGTHTIDQTKRVAAFDAEFAGLVKKRFGGMIVPGVLTVAVGNPDHSAAEIELLLPAVRAAIDAGGFVAYHGYWGANPTASYLESAWQWHAGRWTEWDQVFTSHGLYPRYYLGESGACLYSQTAGFDPGRGWKSCGDFPRHLAEIEIANRKIAEWNAAHQGRCRGLVLFTTGGGTRWKDFEVGDGEIKLLAQWAKRLF